MSIKNLFSKGAVCFKISAFMGILILTAGILTEALSIEGYSFISYAKGSYSIDDSHYNDTEPKIYDDADLFTDSEEEELQESLVSTAKRIKLDLVIVTTDYNEGKESLLYASDFYDDNGFGYDYDCGSGVILLIDMDNREVAISTAGVCRVYLDSMTDDMTDEIAPYLSDREYMKAARYFISKVNSLAMEALEDDDYEDAFDAWYSSDHSSISAQNDFYDKYIPQENFFTTFKNPLIDMVIGVVIAGIAVLIMGSSSKTGSTINERTYMEGGNINLRVRHDQFTHTTTRRRKIETDSSTGRGGGHGGGHVSSSGHSHGGSSKKF